MRRAQTVRDAWSDYRRKVMAASAPADQIRETRRAFYAGAEVLLCQILAGLDPGPDTTESDMEYLVALHNELLQFARDVQEGRA